MLNDYSDLVAILRFGLKPRSSLLEGWCALCSNQSPVAGPKETTPSSQHHYQIHRPREPDDQAAGLS